MANLFAQNSANWDAANQWNTAANGSGSFTTPGSGDVCMANNKTVTINISVNLGAGTVRNDATGGATAGGSFTLNAGVTLTANVVGGAVTCVTCATTSGNTSTIVGNITGGTASAAIGVSMTGTGTITITGTVTGGSAATAYGLGVSANATVNVSGLLLGGSNGSANGVNSTSTGTHTFGGGTTSGVAAGCTLTGVGVTFAVTGACTGTGTGTALNVGVLSGANGTINGAIVGGAGVAIAWGGTGSLTITGNVTGGSNGAGAFQCTHASGTVTINGTVTGGTTTNSAGISASNGGTVTIVGAVTGSSTTNAPGISFTASSGTINITGDCTAGNGATTAYAVTITNTGTLNITGNCLGSAAVNCPAVNSSAGGTVNVTGNCTGGAGGGAALVNVSTGTVNITGTAFGTSSNSGAPGVSNQSTGACWVQLSQSNDYPNSSITLPAVGTSQTANGGFISVDAIKFGTGGVTPILGRHFIRAAGTNFVKMRDGNAGTEYTLGEVTDYPAIADVRFGTAYGSGTYTGTLRVPAAASVLNGVLVDATSGTATLAAADIRAALGFASANFDTQEAAIKTVVDAVKVKTDFLPSATAGAAGGVQIAGSNAATTYASLTSTGAFSINGVGNVAQTGDNFARLGAPVGASISADVAATKALLPTALVGGKMDSHVNDIATGAITAASIAADAITDAKVAADVTIASVTGAVGSVTGAVGSVAGAVGSVTGNVGGNVVGTVGSVVGAVGSVTGLTVANLDVAVSTRLASAGYTAPDNTSITAIKTKTDNLPSDPADASDIAGAFGTVNATLATVASYIDTEVAAIKAKTDNLPASPAAVGSAMTLTSAYDAAKTAATQTSVDDLPTNAELSTALAGADDAVLAAISGISSIDAAGVRAAVGLASANLDTQIAALPASTRDVSNSSPAAGSWGEASRNADAKAADIQITLGAPANGTVSQDIADVLAAIGAISSLSAADLRAALGMASANLDTQLDALPTNTELATALGSADDAVIAALATISTAIADKTGYRLSATGVNDILRTALTEGYAADGAPMTLEQALYMVWSMLGDKAITGTTLTTKKLDGTTAAMTFTLAPSGTAPTSQARAS